MLRKIAIILAILILIPITMKAQEPPTSAFMAGAIYNGDFSARWGMGTKISGPIWTFAFGDFGTTVEADVEVAALFTLKTDKFYAGPVLSAGHDWSNEPGPGGVAAATYLTNSVGLAAAYTVGDVLGVSWGTWVFGKYQSAFDTESNYDSKFKVGFGLHAFI